MDIIDGLSFYEFTLLILGVILFIVLLIILLMYVKQQRSLKALIPFFVFPIIMVGFSGYQKITYDNGVLSVEKTQEAVAKNPNDTTARKELKIALSNLNDKNISNPQTHILISKGYAVLGDTISALTSVNKALLTDSKLVEAKKLFIKFDKPRFRTH
jgi:hypothetical protein